MNMYVSNLNFSVTGDHLKKLFSAFGEVVSATVINDRETNRSRGFGFVEMSSEDAAKQAISELNNKEVEGRPMSVSVAREREKRTPRNKW